MKLRFSIRDLLWLTPVVALCLGWWMTVREFKRYQGKRGNNLKQLPIKTPAK